MQTQVYSIDEIRKIVAPIAKQHGVDKVFLFGSYARGAAEEDSDVDVMILLDLPREQLSAHSRAAARIAADVLDEYGVVVSPLLESEAFFARNRTTYPFFRNIDREGIRYVA